MFLQSPIKIGFYLNDTCPVCESVMIILLEENSKSVCCGCTLPFTKMSKSVRKLAGNLSGYLFIRKILSSQSGLRFYCSFNNGVRSDK